MKHIFILFLILVLATPARAALKVVASYPPIQSLVHSITEGVYPVSVLFTSPTEGHHDVPVKPSQMRTLRGADVVFWVGPELESFMPDALTAQAPNALSVPLMDEIADLDLMPNPKDETKKDPHFWMDVNNALLVLDKVTDVLSQKDPANSEKFQKNRDKARSYLGSLEALERPNPQKRIVALHDGFEYMTRYFGLNATTLGIDPENVSTPQAFQAFQKTLAATNPDCVIIEPNMTRRQIKSMGLDNYNIQKLDGFGWNINQGAGQYYRMMRWNMRALQNCVDRKK